MGCMHYRRILESVSVLGESEIYFHSDVYCFSDGEDFLMCTLVSAGQDDGQFFLNIHFKPGNSHVEYLPWTSQTAHLSILALTYLRSRLNRG
jgi:hypothetical protein